MLVAYFAAQQVIFSLHSAVRAAGQATLVTGFMQGFVAETWIGFLSEDDLDAADSVYAGTVDV